MSAYAKRLQSHPISVRLWFLFRSSVYEFDSIRSNQYYRNMQRLTRFES